MFKRNRKSMTAWAKDSGARDGKAEIPSETWGKDSVPFFIEALSEYQKRAKSLVLSSRINLNAKVDGILGRAKEIDFLQTNLQIQESHIKKRESQIKDLICQRSATSFSKLESLLLPGENNSVIPNKSSGIRYPPSPGPPTRIKECPLSWGRSRVSKSITSCLRVSPVVAVSRDKFIPWFSRREIKNL